MLILGLLLLACTAAFTGLVIADNLGGGAEHDVTVLGYHIATMNGLAIFCAGLALALIFGLGAMMAVTGGVLRRRRSRKIAAARKEAAAAARERDELAARLAADPASAPEGEYGAYEYGARRDDMAANRGMAGDQAAAEPAGATPAERPAPTPHRRHARHLFGH